MGLLNYWNTKNDTRHQSLTLLFLFSLSSVMEIYCRFWEIYWLSSIWYWFSILVKHKIIYLSACIGTPHLSKVLQLQYEQQCLTRVLGHLCTDLFPHILCVAYSLRSELEVCVVDKITIRYNHVLSNCHVGTCVSPESGTFDLSIYGPISYLLNILGRLKLRYEDVWRYEGRMN